MSYRGRPPWLGKKKPKECPQCLLPLSGRRQEGTSYIGLPCGHVVGTSKFKNIPTTIPEFEGVRFASRAEALRARQLYAMQQEGLIADLVVHPRFQLSDYPRVVYSADFSYRRLDGPFESVTVVCEDIKGGQITSDARCRMSWFLNSKWAIVHKLVVLKKVSRKDEFEPVEWRGVVGRPKAPKAG